MDLLAAGTAGHVQYGELSELFGLANETSIPCLQVNGGILECFASPTQ
jgi:hypothetical protein